jgi:hypothetical protein
LYVNLYVHMSVSKTLENHDILVLWSRGYGPVLSLVLCICCERTAIGCCRNIGIDHQYY